MQFKRRKCFLVLTNFVNFLDANVTSFTSHAGPTPLIRVNILLPALIDI